MDILRYGSERFRGTTGIISDLKFDTDGQNRWEDNVHWDKRNKTIVIKAPRVRHTDGKTHHTYEIVLTLDDVTALIVLVGHAGTSSDARLLRDRLAENVPALVKLLACATGLTPTPIPAHKTAP